MALYGDGTKYGSGVKYLSLDGVLVEYTADQELHCHRLSTILRYTAAVVPGMSESLRIHSIRPRLAIDSQQSFTHEAFIDAVTPSTRLACTLRYTGSDFQVSHIQLIGQTKKQQPRG